MLSSLCQSSALWDGGHSLSLRNKALMSTWRSTKTASISRAVMNRGSVWDSPHMHHNKPIKSLKALSHRPPAAHQIHHQTDPCGRFTWPYDARSIVSVWVVMCASASASTPLWAHTHTLWWKRLVISNWIFTSASCLLRSEAFGGADYCRKQDTRRP